MNREEELKKEVEKLEAKLEAFKKELDKPKTHYPLVSDFHMVQEDGRTFYHNTGSTSGLCARLHASGNHFSTGDKLKRSNLYKLLNSEYDYWFPGFSEKPDFEPNGLEYWDYDFQDWSLTYVTTKDFKGSIYRWKRSEN